VGIEPNTAWSINDESFLTEFLYGSTAFFSIKPYPDLFNTTRTIACVRRNWGKRCIINFFTRDFVKVTL